MSIGYCVYMARISVITELIIAGKQNLVICDNTCSMAYVYLFFITRCTCNTHALTLDKGVNPSAVPLLL